MDILKHSFKSESSSGLLESCGIQPKIPAMSEIGKNIKARLQELGETQGWLAEIAGVSNMAVSNWIKLGSMSLDNAIGVADALGITLDELVKGDAASKGPGEPRGDLVKVSPIERRVLTLFRSEDDRGKLEMLSSLEEYVRGAEKERRRADAKVQRAQKAADSKVEPTGVVEPIDAARRKP